MHPLVKHRKHISRFLVFAVLITILFVVATVILSYRIKEITERLVYDQTNGEYALSMKKLRLSIWRGRIELENAKIVHADSVVSNRFIVQVPAVYFELRSWNDLLFNKKLSVDSVMLTSPSLELFEGDTLLPRAETGFQNDDIFEAINTAVSLLDVRSFHLVDGSFVYHPANNRQAFESHHINLTVSNFHRDDNNKDRFLSADDVDMRIRGEGWKLADNNREIQFKELRFSGRKQSFELDSVQFNSRASDNQSTLQLNFDKLAFRSKALAAFYENNVLLIDTLQCIRPVLRLQLNTDTASLDTASVISESLKSMVTNIHIQHFNIKEGQFTIEERSNGKSSLYTTEKTDLRIDDLSIRPDEYPFLTTGNIDLKLKEMHFYTPDSLYQLTVEEFDLYNSDLRFKNAFFSPTAYNHEQESFTVNIPILTLRKLDLEKLIAKRLEAATAEMDHPIVTIRSRSEKRSPSAVQGNWSGFFDGIRGLRELMQVKMLSIRNGTVSYQSLTDSSVAAKLSGFTVSVLLNEFLKSKSFLDIRHAIPLLEAGEISFTSKSMTADIAQLKLIGALEQTAIHSFQFVLANGMTLNGEDIYWQKLDWDELKNRNAIVADSVSVGELSITNDHQQKFAAASGKELPVMNIRKLGISKFKIHFTFPGEDDVEEKMKGKDILFTDLSSQQDKLIWTSASGVLTNFEYTSSGISASTDKISFEAPGATRLSGVHFDSKNEQETVRVRMPDVNLVTTIASSDFSRVELPVVTINQPILNITQKQAAAHSPAKPVKLPVDLVIGKMKIHGAQFNYKINNSNDTSRISATADVSLNSLVAGENAASLVQCGDLNLMLFKTGIQTNKAVVTAPNMELNFSGITLRDNGGKNSFQSLVKGKWNDASISIHAEHASTIEVNNLSGALTESKLDLEPGSQMQWKDWVNRISIGNGRVQFNDSLKELSCNRVIWNPADQTLQVDSFRLQPKQSHEEFFVYSTWQADYIRMQGGSLIISGFDIDKWKNDSIFKATKISLADVNVDVWRDKRIPLKHGVEKSMPTQLINSIRYPIDIDSFTITNGNVNYREFSKITNREGLVPLTHIEATVQHVRNMHPANRDTLTIRGKAQFLSSAIKKFRYAEAYGDSLGSFKLSVKATPVSMSEFSRISNPLAAVNIEDGQLDTMTARISGNKYAAIGEMKFYYHDLKVSVLDHEDTTRNRISLSFVNFVANKFVIKTNNGKQSRIFYIRDREKFVFNYWIKSMMSGMLTSAGVKSNKAYEKQYQKLKEEYALPESTF